MIITTLQDVMDEIHANYEVSDINTPDQTTDEWKVRLRLVWQAIDAWKRAGPWRSLAQNLADAADGDKLTVAGKETYSCPANYDDPVGFLQVTYAGGSSKLFRWVPFENLALFSNDTSTPYFYVTGSYTGQTGGYKVTVKNGGFLGGETLDYPYFRQPAKPSSPTDTFDLDNPNYCVMSALTVMFRNDGSDQVQSMVDAKAQAGDILDDMIADNIASPFFQNGTVGSDNPFGHGIGI